MKRKLATQRSNRILLPMLLAVMPACGVTGLQRTPAFDAAEVDAIHVRVEDKLVYGVAVARPEVSEKIAENLSGWGYKVSAGDEAGAAHELIVEVGEVEHASTPVGFSFSAGNSDPRALDFQKADVLNIACALQTRDASARRAEMSMGFQTNDYRELADRDAEKQLIALLENDASTVCFNLLEELDVPKAVVEAGEAAVTPGWIPEIRLEVENAEEIESAADEAIPAAGATTAPVGAETSASLPQKEPRKRIIIHNQGSPVIFSFGHERK